MLVRAQSCAIKSVHDGNINDVPNQISLFANMRAQNFYYNSITLRTTILSY